MNGSTLESRIMGLLKSRYLNNYNQRLADSSSVGTLIPTPGLSHAAGDPSSMVTTPADATLAGNNNSTSATVNTENLLAGGGNGMHDHEGFFPLECSEILFLEFFISCVPDTLAICLQAISLLDTNIHLSVPEGTWHPWVLKEVLLR